MRYLIEVRIADKKVQVFPIDASNEDEAKERLALRLPPDKRNKVIIDSITIDPKTIICNDEPYGTFGEE